MADGLFETLVLAIEDPNLLEYVSDVPPWASGLADCEPAIRVGAMTTPAPFYPGPVPVAVAVKDQSFVFDFYYRIWAFPLVLQLRNPRTNVDIPFDLWNAYPDHNHLVSIVTTGADGLTLDIVPGATFHEVELRTVNLQITSSAPLEINATFTFNFEQGSVTFSFIADRASVVSIVPDVPVREKWEWFTNVMVATDGTEQRVALRNQPRRTQSTRLIALNEPEVKEKWKQFLLDLAGQVVVPYFQYATDLTADALIGQSTIYFDASRTDLRDGEYALIVSRTGEMELLKVQTLAADSALMDAPITINANAGSFIMPSFTSVVQGKAALNRYAVHDVADVTLESMVSQARTLFSRPGSTVVIPTHDGYPVLLEHPIADENEKQQFDTGAEVFDYGTGAVESITRWNWTRIATTVQFLFHRATEPQKMDFWRDFLGAVQGMLNPFFMPSWRKDLLIATAPSDGSINIEILGSDYGAYFWSANFKFLELHTAGGILYRTVESVTLLANGNTDCKLTVALPTGAAYTSIEYISFLRKMRLANDTVSLEHYALDTLIEFSIRTVPE